MEASDLVGVWSDDPLYSGAMECIDICLRSDGLGLYVRSNLGGTRGCLLSWSLSESALTVRVLAELAAPDGMFGPIERADGEGEPWEQTDRPCSVLVEKSVLDRPLRVLRLLPSGAEDAFAFMGEIEEYPQYVDVLDRLG
jgi:hypothetical protein